MFASIVFVALLSNVVFADDLKNELQSVLNATGDPFSELPCMLANGICAKHDDCPGETKVIAKGMCPVQQKDGVECCRRTSKRSIGRSNNLSNDSTKDCRSSGGDCVSIDDFSCPHFLTVREATDCGKNEVCCIFIR